MGNVGKKAFLVRFDCTGSMYVQYIVLLIVEVWWVELGRNLGRMGGVVDGS